MPSFSSDSELNIADLFLIGQKFRLTEKTPDILNNLDENKLLKIMRDLANFISPGDPRSKDLLGTIGACAHLLITRNSHLVKNNTGIPFK